MLNYSFNQIEANVMITSGFILRQYREIYGIKQWLMAARLGFSSAVLCDVEKGRRELTPDIKQKAEKIFRQMAKDHSDDNRIEEILSKENVLESVT